MLGGFERKKFNFVTPSASKNTGKKMSVNIAVVGAGVIGLSTAINVQRAIPNAHVTVIADKFYEDTTSYGSGGMFIPSIQALPNTPVEDLR